MTDAIKTKRVMLALSTFRRSDNAIDLAISKARETLLVVFVADINLARYLIGADLDMWPGIKNQCEEDLLAKYEAEARTTVQEIVKKAEQSGLSVRTHVSTGRFALECLRVVEQEKPDLIVTTRSRRPDWVRRFFGSPVDHLIREAPCEVITA